MAQPEDPHFTESLGTVRPSLGGAGLLFRQSDGHQLVRHRVRIGRRDFDGLLDHGFLGGTENFVSERHPQRGNGADYRSGIQDDGSAHRDSAWSSWFGLAAGKART